MMVNSAGQGRRRLRRRSWSRRRGRLGPRWRQRSRTVSKGRTKGNGRKKRCCSCSPSRSRSNSWEGGETKGKNGTPKEKGEAEWEKFVGENTTKNGRLSRDGRRMNSRRFGGEEDITGNRERFGNSTTYKNGGKGNGKVSGKGNGKVNGKGMTNGKWRTRKSVTFTSDEDEFYNDEGDRETSEANRNSKGRSGRGERFLASRYDRNNDDGDYSPDERTETEQDGSTKIVIVTRRLAPGERRWSGEQADKTTRVTKYRNGKIVKEITKSMSGKSSEKVGQKTTITTNQNNDVIGIRKKTRTVRTRYQNEEDDEEEQEEKEDEEEEEDDDDDDDDDISDGTEESDEDQGDEDQNDADNYNDDTKSNFQLSINDNKGHSANLSMKNIPGLGSYVPWRQTYVCLPSNNNQLTCRPNIIPVPLGTSTEQIHIAHDMSRYPPQGCPLYGLYPKRV
ncbi:hypothetical protein LSH36_1055g00095 [Paralvinella palmiformis]|uniref:Uncharacterized protein n=1 Tax=Paralvinella palmiformis TaxID=53620 RepID=A0AAD9MST5_9ANNE|nr:hypothetical protein LSH36_1055g00095 [Paralvinella palmiformis]